MDLTRKSQSLTYNVTATAQNHSYGYGPAYIINGLSDQGYWYQVGLGFNWGYTKVNGSQGGIIQGFNLIYLGWSPSRVPIYPSTGGSGIAGFSGLVRDGDIVRLSLNITEGVVAVSGKDWNTDAVASTNFTSNNVAQFVGSFYPQTFFTGLLTEWHHVVQYYCSEKKVIYSNYVSPVSTVWMCILEQTAPPERTSVFHECSSTINLGSNLNAVHSYIFAGTTIYANAFEFVTS